MWYFGSAGTDVGIIGMSWQWKSAQQTSGPIFGPSPEYGSLPIYVRSTYLTYPYIPTVPSKGVICASMFGIIHPLSKFVVSGVLPSPFPVFPTYTKLPGQVFYASSFFLLF